MARYDMFVLPAGPGEPVPISVATEGLTADFAFTPTQALILADSLVRGARVSMFGTAENPVPPSDAVMTAIRSSLDLASTAITELVKVIPESGSS